MGVKLKIDTCVGNSYPFTRSHPLTMSTDETAPIEAQRKLRKASKANRDYYIGWDQAISDSSLEFYLSIILGNPDDDPEMDVPEAKLGDCPIPLPKREFLRRMARNQQGSKDLGMTRQKMLDAIDWLLTHFDLPSDWCSKGYSWFNCSLSHVWDCGHIDEDGSGVSPGRTCANRECSYCKGPQ